MKVKTVSTMAVAFAMAFMGLLAQAVFAQRGNGTFRAGAPPAQRPATAGAGTQRPATAGVGPQRPASAVPPVIFPMSNPIAPMGNPVAPIMPVPFMRYSTSPATVVFPDQSPGYRGGNGRGNNHGDGNRGRGWNGGIPIVPPTYYYPSYGYPSYAYPDYGYGLTPPVTIPGQLPGVGYDYLNSQSSNPNVAAPAAAPAATAPVAEPQPEYYPEPRIIVKEPRPNRVIEAPAIGTSRDDVVARLGAPWGSFTIRGQETAYFDGLVVMFSEDGRVIQVRHTVR